MGSVDRARTAIVLDLDGTLVDSVYVHVVAWVRAFQDVGLTVSGHHVHQLIGMGGDRLVAAATSDAVEHAVGDRVRERHADRFEDLVEGVAPTVGVDALVEQLSKLRVPVTLATSGGADMADRMLDLVPAVRGLLADSAAAPDAQHSKPSGELLERSLRAVDAERVVVIGDTVWDVRAAQDAGALCVGLMTGGIARSDLIEAGAVAVYPTPGDLAYHLSLGNDVAAAPAAPR